MKSWLQQSFYVATQDAHVATITRQLQQNFVVTFSNYVATENCKPRKKLGNKDDNYVTT